ncbi:MAG: hydantoinase/oxoprolinase family protein [Candidatus Obscuribacterales bacterium]|nr:hydantoinase/oxoprolinase family protein [Candidatus Obscuribacterales bacterium]
MSSAESSIEKKVRIGIDVGGTFTHAVALDSLTLTLLGHIKVPTTHQAKEGVALGIVQSLEQLLAQTKIQPSQVSFIAHSTTQATNALLEGDVAKVGIIALGNGASALMVKQASNLGKVEIAAGKFIETLFRFIDTKDSKTSLDDDSIKKTLSELTEQGCKAIAVTEGFSVDDPANENKVLNIARSMGLLATSGAEVSQLYGLKVRTRTAVINASMLPKMLESANMTESSVRAAGISAPLMIMRSDGGVMDIEAMRKRPILTMLSGPAAGVAAATMFLRISDGIFVEVGGTSTDISAIANGRALVKGGEIGGNKVYMRTLDVRTLGVAGGSMLRVKEQKIIDVGPRSAHIAGLGYVSFVESLKSPSLENVQPLNSGPSDYVAIKSDSEIPNLCLTPTCAANLLDLVPADNCAIGNKTAITEAFDLLGKKLSKSGKETAEEILHIAAQKCIPTIKAMLKEYKLDKEMVTLVGGGGGAAAIVPAVAKELEMKFEIAQHADVISAIGVALALIRETVERQIANPTKEDILRLRHEAGEAVMKMGAEPSTVEVHLEIDNRTNIVRATAYGATKISQTDTQARTLADEQMLEIAAGSLKTQPTAVKKEADSSFYHVFSAKKEIKQLLGLLKREVTAYRVIDQAGSVRLQSQNGQVAQCSVGQAEDSIVSLIEKYAHWGDAGKVIPNILLLQGAKIIDLSGLLDTEQVLAVAKTELESLPADEKIVVLAQLNH